MKKMCIKILSVVLCAVMVLGAAPLGGFIGLDLPSLFEFKAEAATYSGTCGDNLTWSLDTSTGVLNISGTGAMKDYHLDSSPWYSYRSYIKTVNIPDGLTTIGSCTFYNCANLTNITIPDSVTAIGVSAFSECTRLKSVSIPESLTTIGNQAFAFCTSLTSLTIPDNVTTIGTDAFHKCASLTNITVDSNNKNYSNDSYGALFNKEKTTLIQYPVGNTRKSYTIPDSVITIEDWAFVYCDNLSSVTISNGVKTIGDNAFYNSDSLTSVTIGNRVTTIGAWAFSNCTKLTNVTIGNSVTTIDSYAFYDCTSLTSVTIPDSVTTIGSSAFEDCTSLASAIIGNDVTNIGGYAFAYCTSLTEVTIGKSVISVGDRAFVDCNNLDSVYYTGDIASWCGIDFYNSLSQPMFYADNFYINNIPIEKIEIPNIVTEIKAYAFCRFIGITSVTIGNGVRSISDSAFIGCIKLNSVIIDNSVTTIGDNAFSGCDNLTSIKIPNSVTDLGNCVFQNCKNLENVIISNDITSIGRSAFDGCYNLTSVTIPNSVVIIGDYAFRSCDSLADIYYSGSEEQWTKISIGSSNEPLLNATIHFNSTGLDDDNTSGDEPSYEEKYKNATITLDKDSYTVKEPDLLKITGTISCPDGVDGLLMYWSYDDSEAFYTTSPTTYETVSETEKRFSVTFSPKKAGKFKIYAVLPNGAKFECTVESYKSCAPAYITEHLQFIESNEYNNFLNSKTAENLADSMRSNPSYHWNNAMSINFFENYYDIVLAELITGATTKKTMLETFYGAWSKECTGLLKEVFDFLDSSGEVNFENVTFEEFLDVFNTNNPDAYKNTTIYKMVVDAVGNDHTKIINAAFKTSDIIGVAGDIFSASLDVYDGIRECVYYFSAINAYRYTSEYFKDVIQKASELTDNSDLKESLDTYASIDSKSDYIDFAKSLYERARNSTIQTAVKVFFDMFGIGRTAKFVTNIVVKGGAKLASKVVTVSTKTGAVTATVAQIASGAIAGVTLGMAVSDIITNADDYSQYASKCTHSGDFAEVFAKVLKEFENNFNDSKTIEDALRFDAAFNLYKDTQIYALTSIAQSVNAQENSLVAKILNLKGNIAPYISKINCYLNLRCHEHELDELVTGEYYFIDEKYSGNKIIRVACPVDIYVYDSAGNLAVSIENDFVEIFDDRLNAYVLNSEKYICVPLDEEFTIKIVSTDAGEMDYSVFEFDENSKLSREVSKENISLETNKTFDGKINNILNTDADNYNLTVSDTQEKIAMENDINCVTATDIEVSESTISLKTGQSKTLYATVSPSNTTDEFAWISSDETVATVSENGDVKAIGEGKATIIAIFNDLIYAECEVDVVDSKDYTVCWIVDGVSTFQIFTEGDSITKPVNPGKKGYEFVGWTPEIPTTMPAENLTFTAQFELTVKEIKIKTPTTTTVNYGDTLVLQLEDVELPEGIAIEWSLIGDAVTTAVSEDGKECRVTSTASGNVSVIATLVDENGEPVLNANGNEIFDDVNLKSNASFWQKIVSFFKNLFRINRIIY